MNTHVNVIKLFAPFMRYCRNS